MKILLLTFLILSSFTALAQDDVFEEDMVETGLETQLKKKRADKAILLEKNYPVETGIEKERRGKQIQETPEWNFTYLRIGQNKLSFQERESADSLTFGNRRVADSFYYDLSYTTLNTSETKTNLQTLNMGTGWQANWAHRLKPYVGVQLGYSWMKSKELDVSDSGFYSGLDAGVILQRSMPFLFILGTRYGVHNFGNKDFKNIAVQEVYLSIGLELF